MGLVRNLAIATGATVAIAGGAVAYVHFNGLPWASSDAAATASAAVIPDEASLALSLSADPKVWGKLSQFGSPALQGQIEEGLKTWQDDFVAQSGLSLEQDILPVVSGMTLALLPPTEVESSGSPEFLVVFGIKNPTKAIALLGKLQDGEAEVRTSEHQGVTISEFVSSAAAEQGATPTPMFSALVNQQLVVAPTRRPVEMAIEAAKGEPSLTDVPGATAALQDDFGMNDLLARVYVPSYSDLLTQLMAVSPETPPLSPQVLKQLEAVESVHLGLGLKADGLHLKASSEMDPSLRPANLQPSTGNASNQFPLNTIALIQSRDLNQYWDQMSEQMAALPDGEQLLGMVRSTTQDVDIDLDTEVFDWMTGEFAFGILPVNDPGMMGQLGFAPALVMESGDRPTTEATLKKLDKLADNFLELKQSKAGAVEITEWVAPMTPPEAVVGHGWLDQDSLLVATGQPAVDALTQPAGQTLSDHPLYKEVMAQLPSEAVGYGFINMQEMVSQIQSSPMAVAADPQALASLQLVRGIGMVSDWERNTSTLEIHIALQRSDELDKAAR